VINLPKFKTHGFTYLTAAVKNLFGVLPGKTKVGYHATLKNIRNFSEMLIDLLLYVNPCLTIVDAIVGMDGDGPSAGRARKLGLLLASENPLAVDIVLAEAVKVDPALIPHIRAALDRKLSPQSLKDVKVLGETFESIRVPDFVMPKSMERKGRLGTLSLLDRLTAPFLKDMFSVRPEIIPEVCTGCRICEENCPENAIRLVHAKAHINQRRCIRCYCCHELCPSRSVELRKNPLQTLGKMIR
jgi:ferredoxin